MPCQQGIGLLVMGLFCLSKSSGVLFAIQKGPAALVDGISVGISSPTQGFWGVKGKCPGGGGGGGHAADRVVFL